MEITEKQIEARIKMYKSLKAMKNLSPEQMRIKAIEGLGKSLAKSDIDIGSIFSDKVEIKQAKDLLKLYLADFSIETIADKNTLKEVIYLEIVQQRLQVKLNGYYEKDQKAVPLQLIDVIHKNSKAILDLKNSLGLNKAKNKGGYDAFKHLIQRAKKWREENQGSRTLSCPHCAKMIFLKIRTDAWEAQKHPFFKDKVLYNKHVVELFRKEIITREDVAKILECSTDYVEWLIEKIEPPKKEG